MGVGVDGFDGNFGALFPARGRAGSMLAMNGGGNNRGGETGERSDLDDAARGEDADHRGEEKIIARADSPGMANIVPVDHGMKKIELARRGNFPRVTELSRELPIFDLELLERFELANVEISGCAGRPCPLTQLADFPREFEAAARRSIPNQFEITREGQFQAANFAAPARPDKCLLMRTKKVTALAVHVSGVKTRRNS